MRPGEEIQVEGGGWGKVHKTIFVKIAEAHLTAHEYICLMILFSETYADYGKKEVELSLKEWEEKTKIERRNVDKVLKRLKKRNIIRIEGGGQGRGNKPTYSFNKYYGEWVNPDNQPSQAKEKVCVDTPFTEQEKAYVDTQEKVYEHTQEKVCVDTPFYSGPKKERKEEEAAAAKPSPKPRTISDFVAAYERIWGLQVPSQYIGEQIQEWENRVTLEGWCYALQECTDRRNHGNWKYLRSILTRIEREGYQPKAPVTTPQPSTVLDFSLEEVL